jgi:hypothetical protein
MTCAASSPAFQMTARSQGPALLRPGRGHDQRQSAFLAIAAAERCPQPAASRADPADPQRNRQSRHPPARRARTGSQCFLRGTGLAPSIISYPMGHYLAQATPLLLSVHAVANYLSQFCKPVTRACNSKCRPLPCIMVKTAAPDRPGTKVHTGGIGRGCHPASHDSLPAAAIRIRKRSTSGCSRVAVLMTPRPYPVRPERQARAPCASHEKGGLNAISHA